MKRLMLFLIITIPVSEALAIGDNVGVNAGLPASQNAVIASQNVVNAANTVSSTVDNNLIPASGAFGNQFGSQATNTLVKELPMIAAIAAGIFVTVEATRTAVNYLPKWYSGELARDQAVNKLLRIEAENKVINQMVNLNDAQKKELMRQRDFNEALGDFKWCAMRMTLKNPYRVYYRGFAHLYTDSQGEPFECKSEFNCLVATTKNPEPYKKRLMYNYYYKS